MTIACKRLISILLMMATILTGMIFVTDTAFAATYTKYQVTHSKVGKAYLEKVKVTGMEGGYSEFGGKSLPKSGKVKMVRVTNDKTSARILFYYCVYRNWDKTNSQKLKIQNAITRQHYNKKLLSKSQSAQAKEMIAAAKKYNIPSAYNFKVYRCTTKKKIKGKKSTFLVYTYELTRPRIGVTDDQDAYNKAIKKFGGKKVVLPYVKTEEEALEALEKANVCGILIPGGAGINAKYFGAEPIKSGVGSLKRDPSDIAFCKAAMKLDMPLFGICRGQQIINVAAGGTLFQDIKTQFGSYVVHKSGWQDITVFKDSLIGRIIGAGTHRVYSAHHQAICIIGSHVRVGARAVDGIPEAINLKNKTFILGVQFHPEGSGCINSLDTYKMFTHFLNAAQKYEKRKGKKEIDETPI